MPAKLQGSASGELKAALGSNWKGTEITLGTWACSSVAVPMKHTASRIRNLCIADVKILTKVDGYVQKRDLTNEQVKDADSRVGAVCGGRF